MTLRIIIRNVVVYVLLSALLTLLIIIGGALYVSSGNVDAGMIVIGFSFFIGPALMLVMGGFMRGLYVPIDPTRRRKPKRLVNPLASFEERNA